MSGFETFQNLILEHAKDHIKLEKGQYQEELSEVLGNVIFERPGPRAVNRQLNAEDCFFRTLWNGFIEIRTSYEALNDFEVFVRRFPFPNSRITKTRYLRFVIEAYLAEAYILKERMVAYLTIVGRLYRGHTRHQDVLRQTRPVFHAVSDTLKPLTNLRSLHTHERRFESEELDRLGTLELLSNQAGDDEFGEAMNMAYNEAWGRYRRLWGKRMKSNQKAIGELLDIYSDVLVDVLFEDNGAFKPYVIY
jgi:hypothetical protein